jgi:hypothetical protein
MVAAVTGMATSTAADTAMVAVTAANGPVADMAAAVVAMVVADIGRDGS